MTEPITEFYSSIFGDNVWWATFLIAMIPLVELRGAIPFGMSVQFWGQNALASWQAFLLAFLGSSLLIPIIALVFKPIIRWLNKYKFFRAIISFFTEDIKTRSEKISQKEGKLSIFLKMLYVFLFVAFPVPLTGVWTGTVFAVLLGLNFWQICLSVVLGNFVCGLIVILICLIFPNATAILLYVFLALVVILLTVKVILYFRRRKNLKKEAAE